MSRDRAFLGHMLQALERVSTLAAAISEDDLVSDWKKQDALIRELEVLGEAAGRVSTDFVAAHPEIPCKEITGLRHKLVHDYFEVDLQIVWNTATINVPAVLPLVSAAFESLDE